MKKAIFILAIFLIVTAESRGQRQTGNDDFIKVDVTKNYSPKKELILQDFMDVEYIALETNDDFLNQGVMQDIGKIFLIVTNEKNINDGNIFVYDRSGKAIRKINHKGQSGKEYVFISSIVLDEDNNEMYVHSHSERKIQVYDLSGQFKRSIQYGTDTGGWAKLNDRSFSFYTKIFNYDRENLICYHSYDEDRAFVLISKQDGSITKKIEIPVKKTKFLRKTLLDLENMTERSVTPRYRELFPHKGNWVLVEISSDTMYTFFPDHSLRPVFVRTPSVQSMEPEVFLLPRLFSDRYCFMEAARNEYNFDTNSGFPRTFFMYDKQEQALLGYTVYNGDYSIKKEMYMDAAWPVSHDIESWYPLEAYQLVESYKKGELKGKLKEIAAKLDEEDNRVIMLIKHKK